MRGDDPGVAEGVGNLAGAVAPELIGDGLDFFRARGDGGASDGVGVGHVHNDFRGIAADGLRAEAAELRKFVGQRDGSVADADFGVADAAVGPVKAHDFPSAEDFLVEVDGRGGVFHNQVRSGGLKFLRGGYGFACHGVSPLQVVF